MSINLGSFPVDIHITVGAGEPLCVGTAHIPLYGDAAPMPAARAAVAKVLREAADEIENPT